MTSISRYVINLGHSVRIPPGEGRPYTVGSLSIAVFRTRDGGVYATQASCPQKDGKLAEGLVGGYRVICPLYSDAFDVRGGAHCGHCCGPIQTFPAMINALDEIMVTVETNA